MTDEHRADGVEDAFRLARSGNPETFAEWMGMAEIPLRRILRRFRQDRLVNMDTLDSLPEGCVEPELPDPALGRAINDCIEQLPKQPRRALSARVRDGWLPDREIAGDLRMKVNTFLQNIVRARKLLADCLERRGVRLVEILS